jgi:hypothetical protein
MGSWYTFSPAGLSQESITGNRDDTALDVLGFLESIFIDQAALRLNGTRPNSPTGVKPARRPMY